MPDAFMPDIWTEIAFTSGYTTPADSRIWTDVSQYVELHEGIDINFGRQDERSVADANQMTMTLDNSDGRFTAMRAASPYYPNVKIGRPIRVSATPVDSPEIVANTGAETNVTGWSGLGATVTRSTAQAFTGAASFLCTWTTTAAEGASVFATVSGLTVGAYYRFEARVRVPTSQPRMMLKAGPTKSATSTTNNQWERLTVVFKADATTRDIEVKNADAATSGQTGYFDAVSARLTMVRFVGFVDEWPVEWEGSDAYAKAKIRATSRMARLGLGAPLMSIPEEEILLTAPTAYWTLGDPAGSTTATESSGRGLVGPLTIVPVAGTESPTFGDAIGSPVDDLTALTYPATPTSSVEVTLNNQAVGTLRIAFVVEAGATATRILETSGPSGQFWVTVNGSGSGYSVTVAGPSGTLVAAAGSATPDTLHDLAVTMSSAAGARLYLDGTLIATGAGADYTSMAFLRVGPWSTLTDHTFSASHVALYSTALSATQISEQSKAVLNGFVGDRSEQRAIRFLAYAGVPSSQIVTQAGAELVTYQKTSGSSVIDALRVVEATEGGVLFDGRDGSVTFHNRSNRYAKSAAATLNMAAQHVGADYAPKVDRTSLVNDVTIDNATTGAKYRVFDSGSINEYGTAAQSMASVALYQASQEQQANWLVSAYSTPQIRVPSLSVDVLAHQGLTPSLQTLLGLTISDLIAVANAPTQADSTTASYFVEGYSERIGSESYELTFNLSPSYLTLNVLVLDDANRGKLDTGLIAF